MKRRYTDNLDTLVALVTNLAMTRFRSRTPTALAEYLSLDQADVVFVLTNFRGLFRESTVLTDDGEHWYTLHLRYARRWLESDTKREPATEDEEDPREPLGPEYLSTLLTFISNMVAEEQAGLRQSTASTAAVLGSLAVAFAAIVAAIVSSLSC
jgi:hypothetical protein